MNYENAPATAMIATNCACCARPLLDSVSVEIGMGPHCRAKHGLSGKLAPQGIGDVERKKANRIVHQIACGLDAQTLAGALAELRDMGFAVLAAALEDSRVSVSVLGRDIMHLAVNAPYCEAALHAWRSVPGQKWDRETKARIIPATNQARAALWALLKRHYPGQLMKTEKGLVQIPLAG
jgi:hypothetical protein